MGIRHCLTICDLSWINKHTHTHTHRYMPSWKIKKYYFSFSWFKISHILISTSLHKSKVFTLKVKQPVVLPARWVYSEIAEDCNSQDASCGKPWASPETKGEECYFMDKRRKLREPALKESPLQESKSSGWDAFSLAELWYFVTGRVCCWARRNFSFLCWSSKLGFFLLGIQGTCLPFESAIDRCVRAWELPLRVSWLHF